MVVTPYTVCHAKIDLDFLHKKVIVLIVFVVECINHNDWRKPSMYAIAFEMVIADLKVHYGDPYNGAYDEIRTELKQFGFDNAQGSVYLCNKADNGIAIVYQAINKLSSLGWFTGLEIKNAMKTESWLK